MQRGKKPKSSPKPNKERASLKGRKAEAIETAKRRAGCLSEASSCPSAVPIAGVAPEVQLLTFFFFGSFSFCVKAKRKKNKPHQSKKKQATSKTKKAAEKQPKPFRRIPKNYNFRTSPAPAPDYDPHHTNRCPR